MMLYSYSNENLSATINDCTSLLTNALVSDGVITSDQAKVINERYAVVVAAPTMWGRTIKKIMAMKDDAPVMKIVKLL